MATVMWDAATALNYDAGSPEMFDPVLLGATVGVLADLAAGGRALEFAVGTGRVAIPLHEAGVPVHGIELSPHMADRLRAKPVAEGIGVTVGDMTSTRVGDDFSLVYLVFNTVMNVTTQGEQIAVFANAAAHLAPGGHFVVEVLLPLPTRLAPGATSEVFTMGADHVGIETHDDPVGQIAWSRHWRRVGDTLVAHAAPYRYVWPSELDLMARLAGMSLGHRWSDWSRSPFTAKSRGHISVWSKS